MPTSRNHVFQFGLFLMAIASCNNPKGPSAEAINAINLKSGDIVVCGPPEKEFGSVGFEISCSEKVKKDFDLGVALLHSFEYDEAEKAFAKVIAAEPECAMAYWGVAMANFHPLWMPPLPDELEKGTKAVAVAQSVTNKSQREKEYIDAIGAFYNESDKISHPIRCANFEKAMENIHNKYPNDKESAVFYALALDGAADPTDKTFTKQKKAGSILSSLYANTPNHPGIVHYLIHSYDYPALAAMALPAAREYASIAPSSAHAQHMPSHIFTRLGLWDECVTSNKVSTEAAKCYAESTGIKGHWDEELHSLDYLVYAYLQKGDNTQAKQQCDYLETISEVFPLNFKDAYAFAAVPSRYVLENKMWSDAARLKIHPRNFPWDKFPWQKAMIHFTRVLGFAHIGKLDSAKVELSNLSALRDTLIAQKSTYNANQVEIQVKASEAWIKFKEGKGQDALDLMKVAVDLESKTQKHPVTPGELIPATEQLGDLLMEMKKPDQALEAYELDLRDHPNRFNGLYGAGQAATMSGKKESARQYYEQLLTTANSSASTRPELKVARTYLNK